MGEMKKLSEILKEAGFDTEFVDKLSTRSAEPPEGVVVDALLEQHRAIIRDGKLSQEALEEAGAYLLTMGSAVRYIGNMPPVFFKFTLEALERSLEEIVDA